MPIDKGSDVCAQCLLTPPNWHKLYCLGDYQYPLNQYIHRIKHKSEFHLVQPLAELFCHRHPTLEPPELFTFVPLHWRRFLLRGFNQSEQIAAYFAHRYDRPIESIFRKTRHTQPQQQLTKQARKMNLKASFKLIKPLKSPHIAIVDDVVTTGSTMSLLCEILLEYGVKRIDIYCICRTSAGN
ncbi:ComF family protein [Vibrio sp.]|uniref:ComF family protein n=1 Tax=Vibrio viridaestus TaxID=2487322 RepID=UPI0014099051|nr:ComF family protein [Vibrio viridaestus]MDC0610020.1 ComF family protein [Vibrio sp.]